MEVYRTYIQQLKYNGSTYSKGSVVDLFDDFRIVCEDFPFKKNPEPKELPVQDWAGSDGLDVYVPDVIPMKSYDLEVSFLYVRSLYDNGNQGAAGETAIQTRDRLMRSDISNFINFLYGRAKGSPSDTVKSGRLAIVNEYVGMGRKDIVVAGVDNELYYLGESDPDAVARFKVKFTVYDPTTEVTITRTTANGVTTLETSWS